MKPTTFYLVFVMVQCSVPFFAEHKYVTENIMKLYTQEVVIPVSYT